MAGSWSRPAVPALAASAVVVLGSPFVGELRAGLLEAFPRQYQSIMQGAVAAGGAVLVAMGLLAIRDRRPVRYVALAAAVAFAVGCEAALRTGDANVDAVEAFHFVEYAALTWLFFRVWRHRADPSALLLPGLAALAVGTVDEWFQWFIPLRAGEARDVLMDGLSVLCGLLLSLALDPPARFVARGRPGSWWRVGTGAALLVLLLTAFLVDVHVGHVVRDPAAGTFPSRFTAGDLRDAARDRAATWGTSPPVTVRRVSREDQYLSEGLFHVRRRNDAAEHGDLGAAWQENLILETYFAPVLDHPSYASPRGARWTPAQRADVQARATPIPGFVSTANPYPIYDWPPSGPMAVGVALAVACLGAAAAAERGSRRVEDAHG